MFKLIVNFSLLLLCITSSFVYADFNLPDTGQTTCYQTIVVTDCDGTGQDGAYNINPMSYTDNLNGTVTDNNTGLMWQKEDDNQTYNWYQAAGVHSGTSNPSTVDVCGSLHLGGHDDWRLPAKTELLGIVDYSVPYSGPTIMSAYFPNTDATNFWSSTTDDQFSLTNNAWSVDYSTGHTILNSASDYSYYVRCVRGAISTRTLVDNGNGIVTDSRSRLMWQQGESEEMTWGSALSYCEGLSLGGHTDWKLPNVKELESLMDDTRDIPTIDTTFFPGALSTKYWTSTTENTATTWARSVDFTWGYVQGSAKSSSDNVRCVRGGYAGSLVNLTITKNGSGSGSVSADSGTISWAGNTGTATYSFGSTLKLTPAPAPSSIFTGWTGGYICGGDNCNVNMIGDVGLTTLFNLKPVRITGSTPVYFTTLQGAHGEAVGGDTIEAEGIEFPESVTVSKNLTLKGGFNEYYSSSSGFTSVKGLTIMDGSLITENLVIN